MTIRIKENITILIKASFKNHENNKSPSNANNKEESDNK